MATTSRKKAPKVQLEHTTFGPCVLIERRVTATGNDVLLVEFPDKTTRTLLAAAEFWVAPTAELTAIPVSSAAVPDEPEPEIEHADVEDDGEPEQVA